MTERYTPTDQILVPARPAKPRPSKAERFAAQRRSEPPVPTKTNGELVRGWTDAIAVIDALKLKPSTESNKAAREQAVEQLRDAADDLIRRVNWSIADAVGSGAR